MFVASAAVKVRSSWRGHCDQQGGRPSLREKSETSGLCSIAGCVLDIHGLLEQYDCLMDIDTHKGDLLFLPRTAAMTLMKASQTFAPFAEDVSMSLILCRRAKFSTSASGATRDPSCSRRAA
jgi:hypothetical protein